MLLYATLTMHPLSYRYTEYSPIIPPSQCPSRPARRSSPNREMIKGLAVKRCSEKETKLEEFGQATVTTELKIVKNACGEGMHKQHFDADLEVLPTITCAIEA